MLTDAEVKAAYENAAAFPRWNDWRKNHEKCLRAFAELTDAELSSSEWQEKLWKATDITGVGPGETVKIGDLPDDRPLVKALADVRARKWPSDLDQRAKAIQAEFDQAKDYVSSKLERSPRAKLMRAFAALLPSEMTCVISWHECRVAMKALLGNIRGMSTVEGHVRMRARLRDVLGPEAPGDFAEHARRSMTCWFIASPPDEAADASGAVADTEPEQKLLLWPYHKQNKGWTSSEKTLDAYRSIVRETVSGSPPDDLAENLASDPAFEGQAPNSIRQIINAVKKLGLVELRDGQLFPTEDGEEFLNEDAPEPLIRRTLERVFPFAQILRMHASRPWSRPEAKVALQQHYPNWTSTMIPSQMLRWAMSLGLLEKGQDGLWRLSEEGKYWEKRLPAELPVPPKSSTSGAAEDLDEGDELEPGSPAIAIGQAPPTLNQLLDAFSQHSAAKDLVFTRAQLIALHNALHCNDHKRFVILSGLSGTGKTRVMEAYARLYCEAMKLPVEKHRQLVAVSPDWRDPSGLLGYVNELREDPSYQPGPALDLLLAAAREPSLPFFLLLDEMNLARVELYFAPFLSAMEVGGQVALHNRHPSVNGVPSRVPWPRNLFIIGSVNMDETTHPFSDKVLDRAFTLEFWDVDLKQFFERRDVRDVEAEQLLLEAHDILKPVRRHFGYRTANEFLGFVRLSSELEPEERSDLLDQGVFSKILPRLRGEDSPAFHDALKQLEAACAQRKLKRSATKLCSMRESLQRTGVARFWA